MQNKTGFVNVDDLASSLSKYGYEVEVLGNSHNDVDKAYRISTGDDDKDIGLIVDVTPMGQVDNMEILKNGMVYDYSSDVRTPDDLPENFSEMVKVCQDARNGIYHTVDYDSKGKAHPEKYVYHVEDGKTPYSNDCRYYIKDAASYVDELQSNGVKTFATSRKGTGHSSEDFIKTDKNIAIMKSENGIKAPTPELITKGSYLNITDKDNIYGISADDFNKLYIVKAKGAKAAQPEAKKYNADRYAEAIREADGFDNDNTAEHNAPVDLYKTSKNGVDGGMDF